MLAKNHTIIGSFEIDVCGTEVATRERKLRRKSEISFLKHIASLTSTAEATLQKEKRQWC